MPKYVIEREIPNAGQMTPQELQGASLKSCDALRSIGPKIQWQHSYVTGDKLYCVYIAPGEKEILEHAQRSGFPASKINKIAAIIDPATAEA
ncbi:MAG TPA: DUF4242 domain-containing protein [Rhodothermales bacterium]|nr:DUF4242 domain-containing protein [Rhodothermales bacterium]